MMIPIRAPLLLAAALAGAAGLAGCGRVGRLDQPGPLFGGQAQQDWQAQSRAREAVGDARAVQRQAEGPDPNPAPARSLEINDPKDPNADDAPRTRRDLQSPQQQQIPITKEVIPGQPDLVGPTPSMTPPGG